MINGIDINLHRASLKSETGLNSGIINFPKLNEKINKIKEI